MLIVSNAFDFCPSDFDISIGCIFSFSADSDHRIGLTLVCCFRPSRLKGEKGWFIFSPENEVKKIIDSNWSSLTIKQQALFESRDVLDNLLIMSKGSTTLLSEKWERIWENTQKEKIYQSDLE